MLVCLVIVDVIIILQKRMQSFLKGIISVKAEKRW